MKADFLNPLFKENIMKKFLAITLAAFLTLPAFAELTGVDKAMADMTPPLDEFCDGGRRQYEYNSADPFVPGMVLVKNCPKKLPKGEKRSEIKYCAASKNTRWCFDEQYKWIIDKSEEHGRKYSFIWGICNWYKHDSGVQMWMCKVQPDAIANPLQAWK